MRRLIRLATYLYPAAWRKRYAQEFNALLDDVGPRWTDIANVMTGALKMHLHHGSFWKIATGFALAGMLAATVWGWFGIPNKYKAMGVLAMPAAPTRQESNERVARLQQTLLSRSSLMQVIEKQNLYTSERLREPLEDVIETMRVKDIHVILTQSSDAFSIEFVYPDRVKAQSTLKDLVARLQSEGGLKVLAISEKQVAPRRSRIAFFGLVVGLLTGIVIAAAMRMRRQSIAISIACGLSGFLVAGAISFAIPSSYVSSAVLRLPHSGSFAEQALSREVLVATIKKHHLYADQRDKKSTDQLVAAMRKNLRVNPIGPPGQSTAVSISFTYTDPLTAQWVVQEILRPYEAPSRQIELIDAPSLPQSPIYPNRYVIAVLGLALGLLAGGVFVRVRHPAVA